MFKSIQNFVTLFLFFFAFHSTSFSQGINPHTGLDDHNIESIEWFYTGYDSGGGEDIFKLGKIWKESGDGAKAVDRIRVSVMTKIDEPCDLGNCPNDNYYFPHDLKYKAPSGTWRWITRSSPTMPSDWNLIASYDSRDSYSVPYEVPYSCSYGCGLFNWGTCWKTCYETNYHEGSSGNVIYTYAPTNISYANEIITSSANYQTITFDWINFPPELLDDSSVEFDWEGHVRSESFIPDFGTPTAVDDLEIVSTDFGVELIGTGGDLPSCHTTDNYKNKWLVKSSAIYNDNSEHEVSLGDWNSGAFSYDVKTQGGSSELGPQVSLDYKLIYREYGRGCAIERYFGHSGNPQNYLQLQTNPLTSVDNIIAQNVKVSNGDIITDENSSLYTQADDCVLIEWSQLCSANANSIYYNVWRKDSSVEEFRIAFSKQPFAGGEHINYTKAEANNTVAFAEPNDSNNGALNFQGENYSGIKGAFIDYSADPEKTYLYKVESKVITELTNGSAPFTEEMISSGAGIQFFNDNETLVIETPLPLCDGFSIEGEQEIINEIVRFSNEDYIYDTTNDFKLSFVDKQIDSQNQGTYVLPQVAHFYANSTLTERVYLEGDSVVLPGTQSEITSFELPLDDDVQQKQMYAVIEARRTDGKVFRSFTPRSITGMRKPTPPLVDISSAEFNDFVELRFTDIKDDHNVDHIRIFREERQPIFLGETNASEDAGDTNSSTAEDFTLHILTLDKEDIKNLVVENGQLVFLDDLHIASPSNPSWPRPEMCNDYTYYIESSNCGIWELGEPGVDGESPFFQEQIGSSKVVSPSIQEDLFVIGNPARDLTTSRGEYPHKVHLTWNNNSSGLVDFYTIERRQFGFVGESAWIEIGAVSTGEKFFEDNYAEANLIYEYRIKAHVGNCAPAGAVDQNQANTVSSHMIGFRRPVGRVTGRIIYNSTSNPVENVYVKVEPIINEDQNNNRSLDMSHSYGVIDNPFDMLADDQIDSYSVSFWMQASGNEEGYLFSRFSETYSQNIIFNNNKIRYNEYATSVSDSQEELSLKQDPTEWNNIVMTVADNQVGLYINGNHSGTYNSTFNKSKNDNLIFGAKKINSGDNHKSFEGLMDELVVYKKVLSSDEISMNYLKFLSTSDDDLVVFITGDEGIGNTSFDVSSNSVDVFNKNHLNLFETGDNSLYSNPEGVDYFFSNEFNHELLNLGKSTSSGMYDITDIRYIFDGNNFSITPFTVSADYDISHEFLPAQRTDFVGDMSMLLAAIDFQDLTSKTIQGSVLFDVTPLTTSQLIEIDGEPNEIIPGIQLIDKDIDPIGVDKVFVLLNGKKANDANGEVKTDQNGFFTLSVPIGNQCISFEKNGFTFFYPDDFDDDSSKRGKFCQDYSFNSDANLPNFSCNTYKTLRGRVSGGMMYNNFVIDNIPIGFNRAANTIGSVGFTIMPNDASVLDYDGYHVAVETDAFSGEYMANLIPIPHKINSATWTSSNQSVESFYQDQQYLFPTIEMKVEGEIGANGDFVEDILESSDGAIVETIIQYNSRFDITYRNIPSILVSQNISSEQNWTEHVGEQLVEVNEDFFLNNYENDQYAIGFPVFKERYGDQTYRYNIEVAEVYKNYGPLLAGHDHNSYMYNTMTGESVYSDIEYLNPVNEGELTINNTMIDISTEVLNLEDLSSSIDYMFNPSKPYVFGADQKFLRKFLIEYQEGNIISKWPALSEGQNEADRGNVLLLGDESYGNDFFTFGPQSVDMILRDPFGDGSSASISEGSTITRTSSLTNVNGYSKDWDFHLGLGPDGEISVGFSLGAHTDATASAHAYVTVDAQNSATLSNSSENEITISDTYNNVVSTHDGEWDIGKNGDVYLGESKNLNFGTSKNLKFITSAECALGGETFTCIDDHVIKERRISKKIYEIIDEEEVLIEETNVNATYEVVDDQFEAYESEISAETYDGGIIREVEVFTPYQIGTKTGASIKPGVQTRFAYSQRYLENYLIPKLLFIKNTYLIGEYSPDTELLPQDHPCFGEPSISPCFDKYDIPDKRNYYQIPASESVQEYQVPVLTNYDINTITAILGQTYKDFQSNFNNSSGIINQTIDDSAIDNSLWTDMVLSLPDEGSPFTSIFDNPDPALVEFLDFVSTGPQFGIIGGQNADGSDLTALIENFSSNQDFTSVPGFINLDKMINGLTLSGPEEAMETIVIPRDKVLFYSQQVNLWKRAMAMNELDKIESEFITNHSLNGGISIEQSHTAVGSYSNTTAITYELANSYGVGGDFAANPFVFGFELDFSYNDNYTLEFSSSTSLSGESENTTGYVLNDNDQGDVLSMDVKESKYGFGPIFEVQAGATSCPWEDAVTANYINNFDMYFELKFYQAFTDNNPTYVDNEGCTNGAYTGSFQAGYVPIGHYGYNGVSYKYCGSGGCYLICSQPILVPNMPDKLTFNPETFVFSYTGDLETLQTENGPMFEKSEKVGSWTDYTQIIKKQLKSAFELVRLEVYESGRENLLQQHNALFPASSDPYELSATTSRRDNPVISISGSPNLYNVPEEEQAVFNLVLGNESQSQDNRVYNIRVLESSNPYGAIIKIDGLSPNRDFPVIYAGTLNKTLTVEKGPDSLNYENLKLIIYPECEYAGHGEDWTTSDALTDTVSFSVYFLPSCTDLTLSDNDDDWLINISDSNLVSLKLNDYNINYYSLEDIYLDYKFENEPWTPIEPKPFIVNPNYVIKKFEHYKRLSSLELYNLLHSDFDISLWDLSVLYDKLEPEDFCTPCDFAFYEPEDMEKNEAWITWKEGFEDKTAFILNEINRLKDTHLSSELANSDTEMISLRSGSTNILWNVPMLPKDGSYQIRAKSNCGSFTSESSGEIENISVYSNTHDVYSDRLRPELFGSILPADGILNPNDDVVVTFNEPINEIAFNTSSAVSYIEVETNKNRSSQTHDSYLYFGLNDSLMIPSGLYLNQSFTIEMWIKPESNGVLLQQSNGEDSELIKLRIVDFDIEEPKLQFDYIHPSDINKNQFAIHSLQLSNLGFTHIAIAYDAVNHQIIFLDGTSEINVPEYDFNMSYVSDAPIKVGKGFQGSIHDLRIWNKVAQNIEANRSVNLSGNEANLAGYWPMDELILNPKDKSRYRDAQTSAQWTVDSENSSLILNPVLDGSTEFIPLEQAYSTSVSSNSDFTIELWFNSDQDVDQTIVSLGSWDDGYKPETWSIDLNSGLVQVFQGGYGNSNPILSSLTNFNDGDWHHLAIVKTSQSNTRLYIDGLEVDEVSSDLVGGITSPSIFFGVQKVVNNADASVDYFKHMNGFIDEFRIWNISKSNDRIISEMNFNITEKIGLLNALDFNNDEIPGLTSQSNVPLIRASLPKTSVSFNDVSNGNQISIEITEPLSFIENTSLDFTLQYVKDESGNFISNPISWSTFIDKNQLIWEDQFIQKDKLLGEPLSFFTHIINQGGTVEEFQINNLPEWLNVNPSEGLLDPNSFTLIEFVVNQDLFIGDYKEDILLLGNNNFAERLEFHLNVDMPQPTYSVNAQDYEYVMNFVGKATVDGIRSRDDKDILFAYVNDELRGASSPVYIEEYDSYFIFLSVYGDQVIGEEVTFRLWDASEGKFQSRVKINGVDTHEFQPSFVIGSFDDLAHFEATDILRQDIVLNQGWNWVSFNLNSLDEDDGMDDVLQIPTVMSQVEGPSVSIFKNQSSFTQYAEIQGLQSTWIGSLNELSVSDMFMIKSEVSDTIIYEGKVINPLEVPINIGVGWNWIGYLGQRPMNTNSALSSLNPSAGDVIKNKTSFSMFASESLGWLGTLNIMEGGHGYMLKTENSGTLIYPESSIYRVNTFGQIENQYTDAILPVNSSSYENSMSVVAKIDMDEFNKPNLDNVLGAFSDQLCLGNINATPINEEESLYFITIFGQEGYDISFKYYDAVSEIYYSTVNMIEFKSNTLLGSVSEPYPIIIDNAEGSTISDAFSIYPNPFKEEFEIEFVLENQEYIVLDLFDLAGRKITTLYQGELESGNHKIMLDTSNISQGSYLIELKTQDLSIRQTIIKS